MKLSAMKVTHYTVLVTVSVDTISELCCLNLVAK